MSTPQSWHALQILLERDAAVRQRPGGPRPPADAVPADERAAARGRQVAVVYGLGLMVYGLLVLWFMV